jgi:hypothetical protein
MTAVQEYASRLPQRQSPSRLTSTSWSGGGALTPGDWVRCGRSLGTVGRACGWWLGDWVRYGNARYGDRYKLAAQITGYDAQTLMNMAYVASRFAFSRRKEGLSFSHHAEVAALPQPDQDSWLETAASEHLSVRALREALRKARREGDSPVKQSGRGPLVCPSCGHRFAGQRG